MRIAELLNIVLISLSLLVLSWVIREVAPRDTFLYMIMVIAISLAFSLLFYGAIGTALQSSIVSIPGLVLKIAAIITLVSLAISLIALFIVLFGSTYDPESKITAIISFFLFCMTLLGVTGLVRYAGKSTVSLSEPERS